MKSCGIRQVEDAICREQFLQHEKCEHTLHLNACVHFTMHFPLIVSCYMYLSSINAFENLLLQFVKLTVSSKDMHNFS